MTAIDRTPRLRRYRPVRTVIRGGGDAPPATGALRPATPAWIAVGAALGLSLLGVYGIDVS